MYVQYFRTCGSFQSANHKKDWVQLQIRKVPHLRKVCKSNKIFKTPQLGLCDLRNLFADHPTLTSAFVDKVNVRGFCPLILQLSSCRRKDNVEWFQLCNLHKNADIHMCKEKSGILPEWILRIHATDNSYINKTYKVHDNYIFWRKVWYRSLCANILNYLLRSLLSTLIC
jgi:hypothetical protein